VEEETESPDRRQIPLSRDAYLALERALQWPEDLSVYDRLSTPTLLTEVVI